MNSPQRPITRTKTFASQRPGTSTGVPLRSTMSSFSASSIYSGHENRFSERPLTGNTAGLYSQQENDEIRSDRKLKPRFDTPISEYKSNTY